MTLEDVQAVVGHMVGDLMASQQDKQSIYKVGLNTTRLLMSFGDLVVGWLLLRQAAVEGAKNEQKDGEEKKF